MINDNGSTIESLADLLKIELIPLMKQGKFLELFGVLSLWSFLFSMVMLFLFAVPSIVMYTFLTGVCNMPK